MKYQIEGNVLQAIAHYLSGQPHKEVDGLLKALSQVTPVVEPEEKTEEMV